MKLPPVVGYLVGAALGFALLAFGGLLIWSAE
jgi:hypothetical protein